MLTSSSLICLVYIIFFDDYFSFIFLTSLTLTAHKRWHCIGKLLSVEFCRPQWNGLHITHLLYSEQLTFLASIVITKLLMCVCVGWWLPKRLAACWPDERDGQNSRWRLSSLLAVAGWLMVLKPRRWVDLDGWGGNDNKRRNNNTKRHWSTPPRTHARLDSVRFGSSYRLYITSFVLCMVCYT